MIPINPLILNPVQGLSVLGEAHPFQQPEAKPEADSAPGFEVTFIELAPVTCPTLPDGIPTTTL